MFSGDDICVLKEVSEEIKSHVVELSEEYSIPITVVVSLLFNKRNLRFHSINDLIEIGHSCGELTKHGIDFHSSVASILTYYSRKRIKSLF